MIFDILYETVKRGYAEGKHAIKAQLGFLLRCVPKLENFMHAIKVQRYPADILHTNGTYSEEGLSMKLKSKRPAKASSATFTAQDLFEAGLVGLWANRHDIKDSSAYSRKIREREQKRCR